YYFFDENCAYRLLALIDLARPSVDLVDQVSTLRAIPSDTVRLVVGNNLWSRFITAPPRPLHSTISSACSASLSGNWSHLSSTSAPSLLKNSGQPCPHPARPPC